MLRSYVRLNPIAAKGRVHLVISRKTLSISTSPSSPSTSIVKSSKQSSSAKDGPSDEGPINAKVVWRDDEVIKKVESNLIDVIEPVIMPQPVKQEWISKIPVEYHGTQCENFNNDTEWLPIYRLPYVTRFGLIMKAKVYLTLLSVGICAQKLYELVLGQFTLGATPILLLSSATIGGLIITGDYFRRIACQIYVTEDLRFVRLSRFTFFGRRRDLVLPVECIVPLPETNESYRLPVLKLRFRMPENIDLEKDEYEFYENGMRLPIKLGGILDRERFKLVMGNVFLRVGE